MDNPEMTFDEALAETKRVGVKNCSDAAFMASFCQDLLQPLVGAVSPRLVWEGARKKGLTTKGLNEMCHRDPHAVADLMWL